MTSEVLGPNNIHGRPLYADSWRCSYETRLKGDTAFLNTILMLTFSQSISSQRASVNYCYCSPIFVTQMMEAVPSSETSVPTRTTCRNIPEDSILYSHRRENLKSYTALTGWTLQRRCNVSPVRYELGFYIPEDAILHSHRHENLKCYIALTGWAL
jgi:hypothetical protein